jgi:acyl-CoA reductase-like NAD-dependent aldehyde dehydrogenase
MENICKHYIDGCWVDSFSYCGGHTVINPATESEICNLRFGGKADVDNAVNAARNAFPSFSVTSVSARVELLKSILIEYEKRADDLAHAICAEIGSPLEYVSKRAQVPMGASHFKTAISLAEEVDWEFAKGSTVITREPAGVCALITPWNWPLNQIACKVAPALLAGCTMVLKPSEYSALSAKIFAEILDSAGVPAGVFNLVWGDGRLIGPYMASHPEVDMVSMTGSTAAGASVARNAADSIKRVALELGGKSANILLDDAPFEKAVKNGVHQLMMNSGQSCNAPSRMLVPASKLSEVEALAVKSLDTMLLGDPEASGTKIGPVANDRQYERVQQMISVGIQEGAKLVAGGPGRPEGLEKGYFVKPTIFSVLDPSMSIAREEIFGPVLVIIPYRDDAHAVEIANDSQYGLSAYVYGGSLARSRSIGSQLRVGQVHLNGAGVDMRAPFGGFKQSGIGREWGFAGLDEFTEYRAILGIE